MKQKHIFQYSKEERTKIVLEYLHSNLSYEEIAKKYGIKDATIIRVWCCRFRKTKKIRNMKVSSTDADKEVRLRKPIANQKIEKESEKLHRELEETRLKNKALKILLDVAKESGVDLRKILWARAVDKLCEDEGLNVGFACKMFGRNKRAWEKIKDRNKPIL